MIKAINRSIAARHEEDEKGFTLIELLVVILIIGVLAAIAIPAFLNQREAAWVSQVESDVRNANIAAEAYAVDHNGSYADASDTTFPSIATAGALDEYGFNVTQDVTVVPLVSTDGKLFNLVGTHSSITTGDNVFVYDSASGTTVRTATAPTTYTANP